MLKVCALFVVGMVAMNAYANERILLSAGFESGEIRPNKGFVDSGFIRTLPDPQRGSEVISTGRGGCGPKSNCDLRVVGSESVGGQSVGPRAGKYFLRMQLDKSKDYKNLNNGKEKPRTSLMFSHDMYRFDHDVEEWIGFSVFLPKNYEDETKNVGLILSEISTDSSAQFLKLSVGMRKGDKTSHWYFHHYSSDTSVSGKSKETLVDLGEVTSDKGQWTDFVIRVRSNPFRVDTNPAKKGIKAAKNKLYKGNQGILQVWKAEGAVQDKYGNRKMAIKIDKVNEPVGLVPGTTQGKDKIYNNIRAYKPGWQGHTGKSTSVHKPIWIAWDEVRFGEAKRHGTSYSDVHPTGLACTERCPDGSGTKAKNTPKYVAAPPAPPSNVVIQN